MKKTKTKKQGLIIPRGAKPVNAVAKRVLGNQKEIIKAKRARKEADKLRLKAKKTSSEKEKKSFLKQAKKLEREHYLYLEPSDEAITGKRAIRKAEKALERAKWENENPRK